MQRQSLGSPAGKNLSPVVHGTKGDNDDSKKKRKKKAAILEIEEAEEEEDRVIPERPLRRTTVGGGGGAAATTERSIHLIPLLTLLCFLVLYLCSHDPSVDVSEHMADLGGVDRQFDHAASAVDIERYATAHGGATASAATNKHRSLKDLEGRPRGHRYSSRKLGRSTA